MPQTLVDTVYLLSLEGTSLHLQHYTYYNWTFRYRIDTVVCNNRFIKTYISASALYGINRTNTIKDQVRQTHMPNKIEGDDDGYRYPVDVWEKVLPDGNRVPIVPIKRFHFLALEPQVPQEPVAPGEPPVHPAKNVTYRRVKYTTIDNYCCEHAPVTEEERNTLVYDASRELIEKVTRSIFPFDTEEICVYLLED